MSRKSEKSAFIRPSKLGLFRYATVRNKPTSRYNQSLQDSECDENFSEPKKNSSSLYKIISQKSNEKPQTDDANSLDLDPKLCETSDISSDVSHTNEARLLSPPNSKIKNIINELLKNETKYVSQLKKGIEVYSKAFESDQIPAGLANKKYLLFCNIEWIYEFHERKFLPELKKCGYDLDKIANTFIKNIDNNSFNHYILYAQNSLASQELSVEHRKFFKKFDHDGLGLNSFLLLPIQRVPRYMLMLDEIVKELLKAVSENKDTLIHCCNAEKELHKVLNTINDQCK